MTNALVYAGAAAALLLLAPPSKKAPVECNGVDVARCAEVKAEIDRRADAGTLPWWWGVSVVSGAMCPDPLPEGRLDSFDCRLVRELNACLECDVGKWVSTFTPLSEHIANAFKGVAGAVFGGVFGTIGWLMVGGVIFYFVVTR